jgi:predicted PurR-regulated permease PerM
MPDRREACIERRMTSPDPNALRSWLSSATHTSWPLRGLFVIALIALLREAQTVLAPVLIAVVLTFVLAPPVRWLRRRGVPEALGALLVVAALLGSTLPLAASLVQPAAEWWERAPLTLEQLLAKIDKLRANLPLLAPPSHAASAPAASPRASRSATPAAPTTPPADPVKERIASESIELGGRLLGQSLKVAIAGAATVILLYFLLASEHWMLSRSVEAIPRRRTRALVLGGVRAAQREIGRFLVSLGFINAGVGLATGLAVGALGLPNPTLWGVATAVLNFVPYLGPLILVGLLGIAGMTAFTEFTDIIAPSLAFLLIHAIESNLVSPWFVGRRLSLSPISVFLSVMFWGWLWGIAGALIAVPILIGVRSICLRNKRLRLLCRFLDGEARPVPTLRSLLRKRAGAAGGQPPMRPPPMPRSSSEAVDEAQVGRVDVVATSTLEPVLVARPLEHGAEVAREVVADPRTP